MKKLATVFTLAFVLALSLLVSCNQEMGNGTGSINIIFNNTAKALEPTISLSTYRYQVLLSGPNGETEELTLSNEAIGTSKKDLVIGQWTVTVNALNAAGTIIGSGSTTVEVQANQTATANITVSELVGQGTLTISIGGDNPNNATYTLKIYKNDNGTDYLVKEQAFALDESNVLKAQVTLDNGFYLFKIESSVDKEICPVPEAVRIVKGDSLSASYLIETNETGDVAIVINNTIIQNPSLSLALSTSTLRVGDNVTITANGLEGDNYKYEWYLDKTKVDGETSTLTISNLSIVGEYTVNCIVRDTTSALVWSASKTFEVYDENYKPQTISVNGEVEFYLVSDVAVPQDLDIIVKGKQDDKEISTCKHFITTFSSETELYCEISGIDGYSYYFEKKNLSEKNRTLVYVVIDKELENYGYVHVNAFDTGDFCDPYNWRYQGIYIDDERYIPVLIYGDSRTIKLECGTYKRNGAYYSANMGFFYASFAQTAFTVSKENTVELSYQNNYSTYTINSSNFTEGDYYTVGLMTDGKVIKTAPFRVTNGKLLIASTSKFESLIIFNVSKDEYFKIDEYLSAGTSKEYSAVFSNLEYTSLSCTVPAGRVKVKCVSDGLIPEYLSDIYYRFVVNQPYSLSLNEQTFELSSDASISVTNPLNLGYPVEATTSSQEDENGSYTLLTFKLSESTEDCGTLVVNYSVPDEVSSVNTCWLWLTLSETGVRYRLDMQNTSTKTFTVRAGNYRRTGACYMTDASSGKEYIPTLDQNSFTVQKGETTTITVTLEED